MLPSQNSRAQDGAGITSSSDVFRPGDVAVSSFAGVKLQSQTLPPNVDPLTKTVIDPDGVTLSIFDGTTAPLSGAGNPLDLPLRLTFTGKQIGHVFGLAYDTLPPDERGTPGLYAGATSAFGLNIMGPDSDGDGLPDRISAGAPGATFMEGQFGPGTLGGAGAIWKIDQATGELRLYAEITNSGPGLGGLAFNAGSRTLYASDLDTGVIVHMSGVDSGTGLGQFDHGADARPLGGKPAVEDDGRVLDITSPDFNSADPATWGITQIERRIDAMAVHGGRLYYAAADGPEIWSVGLDAEGDFLDDPRVEFAVTLQQPGHVTAITFDGEGRMLIAIRNVMQNMGDFAAFVAPGPADVMRFTPESPDDPQTPFTWAPDVEFYAVGNSPERREASGGLALQYAYRPDGSIDLQSCHGTLLATGDALGPIAIQYGAQIGAPNQFQPTPGQANVTDFLVINPEQVNVDARGHAGGVAAMMSCGIGAGLPAVAEGDPQFPGVEGSGGGGAPDVADEGGGGGGKFPDVLQGGGGGKTKPLVITKTGSVAKCSPKGGCAFNISVRNPNATSVPGPIVINDSIDQPFAFLTGEPNAPWSCTKFAPFTCVHPGPVPARGALDMRVVFNPDASPETKAVTNCAVLAGTPLPAGNPGAPKLPFRKHVDSTSGLKTSVTFQGGRCGVNACDVDLQLTNAGAAPLSGSLGSALFLSMGDSTAFALANVAQPVNVEILKSSLPPGMECRIQESSVQCGSKQVSLAPNESLSLKLSLKIAAQPDKPNATILGMFGARLTPVGKAEDSMAQAIFIEHFDAGNGAAPPPAEAAAGATDPRCATIPLDPNAPVQTGPVIVAKKGASKCTAKGPCSFSIAVQNTTNAVINGPIVIDELIDAPSAAMAGEPNAPWTCSKTKPFTCSHPGPLAPDSSVDLTLSFTPNVPAGTKSLKNCAIVRLPVNAPQKKADLLPKLLPDLGQISQPKSLHASNELQSSPGLLHLAANTGNNGGVSNKCQRWETTNRGFVVKQANGYQVNFSDLVIEGNAIKSGKASYITSERLVGGTIMPGVIVSGVDYSFNVAWNNGVTGYYRVFIDEQGIVAGYTQEGGDLAAVDLTGDSKWWKCARNEICDGYAKTAAEAAKKFIGLGCGPDEPPGRWSKDVNSHLNWCMGQPASSTFINSETETRRQGLAKCQADRATFCDGYVANLQALNKEFQDRNCTETPAFLTRGPESQRSFCTSQSRTILAALENKGRELLETCKARMAKAEKPAGEVGDGDVGAGGKAPPPTPEQCAVVAIEDADAKPVGGGVGKPVLVANGLQITKTALPQQSCEVGKPCMFNIRIKNTTGTPIQGPITLTESVTGTGGVLNIASDAFGVSPPAPWSCTKGRPSTCTHPPSIAAGASIDMPIGMTPRAGSTATAMTNCATLKGSQTPSCATAPIVQLPPNPPPTPPIKLVLAKNPAVEQCSDLGGGCAFTISITNPGPEEFAGPLEFTDTPSTVDGKPLLGAVIDDGGTAIQEAGVTAPISCKKVGDAFICSTGVVAARIPAGKTVVVPISLKPGASGEATAIKNCAALKGGEPQCRTIPFVKGPLLRAQKIGDASTCVPSCSFSINLKNVGNADAIGPFVISEEFTPTPTFIKTLSGDLACIGAGGKFNCTSTNNKTNVLKPGEIIAATVQIVNATRAPEYTNCIGYDPKANSQPIPFDATFPGRCVTIKDTTPPPPRMAIQKVDTSNGVCKIDGICSFKILLTNKGEGPFLGPIVISDTVRKLDPEGIAASNSPDWICEKTFADTIKCTWRRGVRIEPGQTLALDVIVKPGKNWKKNDTLENCATLLPTTVTGPEISCASVKLDPFAVKVTKSGDQNCELGQDCNFTISLFNPGPIDHIAPVTITDQLTGLSSAQIVSITPANAADPFPCNPAPTQIPFTCTSPGDYPLLLSPNGELQPAKEFKMVVRLPADATAGQFSNCASASDGTGTTTEQSCVTVATTPPMRLKPIAKTALSASCDETSPCDFKVTITNTLGRDMPGPIVVDDLMTIGGIPSTQVALAKGPAAPWVCVASAAAGMQCSHPGPLAVNASLDLTLGMQPLPGSIGTAIEVENCATLQGIRPGFATDCASIPVKAAPPPAACFGGMVLTDGACRCPEGTDWNGKICDGTGGFNTQKQVPDALPVLTPPPVAKPVPVKCAKNQVLDNASNTCIVPKAKAAVCSKDKILDKASNKCVCAKNQVLDKKTNTCVRPKKKVQVCPEERPVGKYPDCCPEGHEFRNKKCRLPRQQQQQEEQKFCEGDRPNGVYPDCCPDDYQYARGKCRLVQQEQQPDQNDNQAPVSKTCPDGTVVFGQYTECPNDKPVVRDCGEGYRTRDTPNQYGNYCDLLPVPGPVVPEQPTCPSSQYLGDDGRCYDNIN